MVKREIKFPLRTNFLGHLVNCQRKMRHEERYATPLIWRLQHVVVGGAFGGCYHDDPLDFLEFCREGNSTDIAGTGISVLSVVSGFAELVILGVSCIAGDVTGGATVASGFSESGISGVSRINNVACGATHWKVHVGIAML